MLRNGRPRRARNGKVGAFEQFRELLQPGDGVIDVGANIGSYSRGYADRVGKQGYVLAIEPHPETAIQCVTECRNHPQVHILQAALWDHSTNVALYSDTDSKRNTVCIENIVTHNGSSVQVPAMTLDSVAKDVPNLRAVKIDAQGAEVHILRGATETLKRVAAWIVEIWPAGLKHLGTSVEALIDIFEQAGYTPQGMDRQEILTYAEQEKSEHGSIDVLWLKQ